jgi:RHS repeat-associated protein
MYLSALSIIPEPTAPQAPNLYNANNQLPSSMASYDAAGNQNSYGGNNLTYDAENRQISLSGVGVNETYAYDGDGKRVEKLAGSALRTVFVYDALGRMAAEYSAAVDTPNCITCYLSPDHLGTARMITNQNGNVVSRHDYLPFGGEIAANQAGRNSQWGSGNDDINQKFTGKERDSESGLDYFGARYYGSAIGRFTSPDWSSTPEPIPYASLSNPQTLNQYAYVANNPLSRTDLNGHNWWDKLKNLFGWAGCWCEGEQAESAALRNLYAAQRQQQKDAEEWRATMRKPGYQVAMAMAIGPLGPAGEELEGAAAEAAAVEEAAAGEAGQAAAAEAKGYAELFEDSTASLKRLSKSEIKMLKQAGEDAEQIKKDIVGAHGSRYDLFKDTNSGDIVIKAKDGSGEAQPTGLNIKAMRQE